MNLCLEIFPLLKRHFVQGDSYPKFSRSRWRFPQPQNLILRRPKPIMLVRDGIRPSHLKIEKPGEAQMSDNHPMYKQVGDSFIPVYGGAEGIMGYFLYLFVSVAVSILGDALSPREKYVFGTEEQYLRFIRDASPEELREYWEYRERQEKERLVRYGLRKEDDCPTSGGF